jgi:hypothetical protein
MPVHVHTAILDAVVHPHAYGAASVEDLHPDVVGQGSGQVFNYGNRLQSLTYVAGAAGGSLNNYGRQVGTLHMVSGAAEACSIRRVPKSTKPTSKSEVAAAK